MSFFALMTAGLAAFAPLVSAYTQPVGDSPSGNAFSAPGSGTTVSAGSTYTVQWDPSTSGTVTLLLLKGQNGQSLSVLYPIAEKIDNSGSYSWSVASDLTAGPTSTTGYGIQLIVDANGQYQYTTPFGVSAASNSSSSTSDFTATPRLGPAIATSRTAQSTTAAGYATTTDSASLQTYATDSAWSTDAVVASVYTDATSTGIVMVTATPSAAATASTGFVSSKVSTTTRVPSGTISSVAAASNTGAASTLKSSFMGLAAVAGVAVLAL